MFIAWGVVMVLIVAMAAIGSQIESDPEQATTRPAAAGADPEPAPTAPTTAKRAARTTTTTVRRATTTTTRAPTTTAVPARPVYCTDYDTWTAADAEMDALEARHGPDTSTWPAGTVDALFAAMDRRAVAVQRVWAKAPDSATITSVEAACTE